MRTIDTLLNASLSGGIIMLAWHLTYPVTKRVLGASWHYALLKISMGFLILPLSLFGPMIRSLFGPNIVADEIMSPIEPIATTLVRDGILTFRESARQIFWEYSVYFLVAWLMVLAALAVIELRRIYKFKRQITRSSSEYISEEIIEIFRQSKSQMGIKREISLRTNDYIKTPLVFGMKNPTIVLPATAMNQEEIRLAFYHELTHIKNGDLWFKHIALALSLIHWFNPVVYLLRRKLDLISELHCDGEVIKAMPKAQRLEYGKLILKVASDTSGFKARIYSSLSTKEQIKNRLNHLLGFKKPKTYQIVLSAMLAVLFVSCGAISAFTAEGSERGVPMTDMEISSEELAVPSDGVKKRNTLTEWVSVKEVMEDVQSSVKFKAKFVDTMQNIINEM